MPNLDKFKPVQDMFSDYFGLFVSLEIIAELCNDPTLIEEVDAGAANDTAVRDYFISALLAKYKLSPWPLYMDTEEYGVNFHKKLDEIAPKNADDLNEFK